MRASPALVLVIAAALSACGGGASSSPASAKTMPTSTSATTSMPKSIEVIPSDEISDADGDGVLDSVDDCPNDPEDHDGFEDGDGCPEADNDKDGILDAVDKCPNDAETYNGKDDEDGCPDSTKIYVISCPAPIVEYVRFAAGSASVPAESKVLLDEVAKVMAGNPQVLLVGIEGFADDPGATAVNVALSQKRADAVVKELVMRGVDAGRLRAKGFGAYCPLDQGKGPEAKARNRRVGFHMLETTSGIVAEPAGCPEATKHGLVLTP